MDKNTASPEAKNAAPDVRIGAGWRYWRERAEFWRSKAVALGWREVRDAANGESATGAVRRFTLGRFTFVAWLDTGARFDGGRVRYHRAVKYWIRVGRLILSIEIAGAQP